MTEFVSIYRKDFLWPKRKPFFPRTTVQATVCAPVVGGNVRPASCPCEGALERDDDPQPGAHEGSLCFGRCPKTSTPEFGEADTCLRKLLYKNPKLFSVLPKPPTLDAPKKLNADRLTSTYQADFIGRPDETKLLLEQIADCPNAGCDESSKDEPEACQCKPQLTSQRELLRRLGTAPEPRHHCDPKTRCSVRPHISRPKPEEKGALPWTTEYREAINRKGDEIMKDMRISSKRRAQREHSKRMQYNECLLGPYRL